MITALDVHKLATYNQAQSAEQLTNDKLFIDQKIHMLWQLYSISF